jgi:N-glycosidase YbiA
MAQDRLFVEDSPQLEAAVANGDAPSNRVVRKVIAKQKRRKRARGGRNQGSYSGDPVYFYEREGYRLSNFSAHAIEFEVAGKVHIFMTCEHAYQASKFTDQAIINKIGLAWSAEEAKAIAHAHRHSYRPDWTEQTKLRLMERIFRAKAKEHQSVRDYLKKTGNRPLVENSPVDSFWGTGPDKTTGRNNAGRLWMKIRPDFQ